MMMNVFNTRHIFISHSWDYSTQYETIVKWLQESDIIYKNYSVPHDNPIESNRVSTLKKQLTEQISHASVVIIVSGMYVAYSKWIEYEVKEAVRMNKPILAIKPRGNERLPQIASQEATLIVNWNKQSVIDGIDALIELGK